MFFKKKKSTNRLYIPTKAKWYRRPRRSTSPENTRKLLTLSTKKRFSRFFKEVILYVLALGFLAGVVIFFLFSGKFSINKIEIARNDLYINNAAISKLMEPYRGHSIFTFSKAKAQKMIQDKYPEFSKVEIRKLLPDRIKVELQTYDIIANVEAYYVLPILSSSDEVSEDTDVSKTSDVVRSSSQDLTPVKQQALLNSIGQAIFDRDTKPELMTLVVKGLSQPVEDRQVIVPKTDLTYINESVNYLRHTAKMEVKKIVYLPIAHEIRLTNADDLTLWLVITKSYKSQLDRFNVAYQAPEVDIKDVAYMDLRVDEKVIFCPRGEKCDKQ